MNLKHEDIAIVQEEIPQEELFGNHLSELVDSDREASDKEADIEEVLTHVLDWKGKENIFQDG